MFLKVSKIKGKRKSKGVGQLTKILTVVFNKFIRLRDAKGSYFVCISCGLPKPLTQMNAGHYYAAGNYSALRFDEDNVHGQCIRCNLHLSGNLIEYGKRLLAKIGPLKLQSLDVRRHNKMKLMPFEIEVLIEIYRAKVKELEQQSTTIKQIAQCQQQRER